MLIQVPFYSNVVYRSQLQPKVSIKTIDPNWGDIQPNGFRFAWVAFFQLSVETHNGLMAMPPSQLKRVLRQLLMIQAPKVPEPKPELYRFFIIVGVAVFHGYYFCSTCVNRHVCKLLYVAFPWVMYKMSQGNHTVQGNVDIFFKKKLPILPAAQVLILAVLILAFTKGLQWDEVGGSVMETVYI